MPRDSATFDIIVPTTGEVVTFAAGKPQFPGIVTNTGLQLREDLSFEEWEGVGEALKSMQRSTQWWVGDWMRYGEQRWGEMYAQALDATDYTYQGLADAKYVASRIEFSRRRENLSWSHHREVAALPPTKQDELLDMAEREKWTHKELRSEVYRRKNAVGMRPSGETCTVDDLGKLIARGEKFGTIYADPPWLYDNQSTRAATSNHYGGMTVDEICALPVKDLAADDAHLHLWITNAFLPHFTRIFEAWGFEFRTTFIWVKKQIGIGNYWRNAHEIMMSGVRGGLTRFADKSLRSTQQTQEAQQTWIECDRGKHSEKPDEVRSLIERSSPGPRLELFGRRVADGWTVWGNEIDKTDLLSQGVPEVK